MQYVLVTGSREGVSQAEVSHVLDLCVAGFDDPFTLVHGGADGADRMAGEWAKARGVPVEVHRAKWTIHGGCRCRPGATICKFAGFRRNQEILDAHEYWMCVAFPRGDARGTNDMIRRMRAHGYSPVIDYGHELEL